MSRQPEQRVKRLFHRNQIAAVEETFRGQKLHGRRRTWHRNGQLAREEFYRDGLIHGVVRQWSETGRLLGSFKMEQGTGTQKAWHDNGRLSFEFSTVDGRFNGRSRLWLHDGTLISDEVNLNGRPVSADEYRQAAIKDSRLPKLRGRIAKTPAKTHAFQKHIQQVFVQALLKKRNHSEARVWLNSGKKAVRSLGRFKGVSSALKFVEELYQAGAVEVIAADIYHGKPGSQFADVLLVSLPASRKTRAAVRKSCAQLRTRKLGAVEPHADIGETHLYLSMT